MGRAEDRIKSLTTRTISLRSRLDQAEENLSARDEELAILREQHDSLRSLVAGRADRIRELEGQISDRNERIDELDTMVHKRDERIADLEERVRNLEQAQSEVPPPSDDLRAIYGIGPKVEARLREQGVTRYAQIAAWNDEDVAAMAELLKVHEKRIRRDDWIGSARELAGFDATSAPPEASSPEMGSAPDPPPASASDSVAQTLRDTDPPAASIPPPDLDGVDEGW